MSLPLVLLVELVLRGTFAEMPEPLYLRRAHSDQSGGSSGATTDLERNVWIYRRFRDPMLRTRIMRGYVEPVFQARLAATERWRCLGAIGAAFP